MDPASTDSMPPSSAAKWKLLSVSPSTNAAKRLMRGIAPSSCSTPSARASAPLSSDSIVTTPFACWASPQASITNGSLVAVHTLMAQRGQRDKGAAQKNGAHIRSTPCAFNSSAFSTKEGTWACGRQSEGAKPAPKGAKGAPCYIPG